MFEFLYFSLEICYVKKKVILIICIFFISFLVAIRSVRAFHSCDVQEFNTNKLTYFNDEQIQINATWDLQYDMEDKCYNRIQIYNETNDIVWSSNYIDELGQHSYYWTVWIQDLNTSFDIDYNIFYIKIYHYWEYDQSTQESFLDTIQIKTIKRNTSCELIGFPSNIKYGELLQVKAVFYDISSENMSYLANHLISFKIISNGIITYRNNFTTNSSGMIEIIIPSINLTKGINILIFEIKSDKFYNNLNYEEKIRIIVNSEIQHKEVSKEKDAKDNNLLQLSVFSFISVLSISLLILALIYYNNIKKARQQYLGDITIKY